MIKRTRKPNEKAAGKPPRQRDLGPPPAAFDGLDEWAAEVAACVPKGELSVLVGMYRRTAVDRRVSAANRRLARKQAQALAKHGI